MAAKHAGSMPPHQPMCRQRVHMSVHGPGHGLHELLRLRLWQRLRLPALSSATWYRKQHSVQGLHRARRPELCKQLIDKYACWLVCLISAPCRWQ